LEDFNSERYDDNEGPELAEMDEESPASSGFSFMDEDGNVCELTQDLEDELVHYITTQFDKLDKDRAQVKDHWEAVDDAIYGILDMVMGERMNARVPYAKQSLQTLISHIWNRSLQSDTVLFSIDGKDKQADEWAPTYKSMLLEELKRDNFQLKMDDSANEAIRKGVVIGHLDYKIDKKKDRHLSGMLGTPQEQDEDGSIQFVERETNIEGPTYQLVDPYRFVFDTENHKDWDACFKGLQSFLVYEDICCDENFCNYEELKELTNENRKTSDGYGLSGNSKKDKAQTPGVDKDGRIELIEFHGNIRLKDGTYLRNYLIVVGGRKKIIRFEENPYYINPFKKWCYEETDDGWGISPLAYIVWYCESASMMLNSSIEAAKMNINPGWFAPKGMLPQKKYYLSEGKVVEFKYDPRKPDLMPQPIQPKFDVAFPFLQFFETASETTTAATRQLSGNVTSQSKEQTATEFQGLQVVGNLIVDRVVDRFNLGFKLPIIEDFAHLLAMYNPVEKEVPITNEKGIKEYQKCMPEMYYGNYQFKISDSKAEAERKSNVREKIDLFTAMNNDPELKPRLKKIDFAKEIWNDLGYGMAGNLFMDDMEFISHYLREGKIAQLMQQLLAQTDPALALQPGAIEGYVNQLSAGIGATEPGTAPGIGPIEAATQAPIGIDVAGGQPRFPGV
jgi:hypothetical protein